MNGFLVDPTKLQFFLLLGLQLLENRFAALKRTAGKVREGDGAGGCWLAVCNLQNPARTSVKYHTEGEKPSL